MNTGDLIKQLSESLDITQKEARRLLYQELDAISQQLAEDNNVIIRGFGTLRLREGKAVPGKTPRKGILFKASQKFKDLVKPWRPS